MRTHSSPRKDVDAEIKYPPSHASQQHQSKPKRRGVHYAELALAVGEEQKVTLSIVGESLSDILFF